MSDHAVDVPADRPEPDEYVADPRRWRILGVALSVGFMSLLDVSIVNVAIPSMRSGLDTTAGTIQWVVSGYALTFGLTLVAGGRLGDAYGRRRMMLIGLTGFVLSSAAVGLAPNAVLLVVARLVQGATAGLLTPQNAGLIQMLFRGPERARAFGMFGFTVSTASALGPVIGGLIIAAVGEENGWRFLFLLNLPIGLAAMVAVVRIVPARAVENREENPQIDVVGALLLGLAVLCLLFPIVRVESGARLSLLLLVGVPVFVFAFARWEQRLVRRNVPPLLDLALLRGLPGYVNGLAVGALYFTGYTGTDPRRVGLSPGGAGLLGPAGRAPPDAVRGGVRGQRAGVRPVRVRRRAPADRGRAAGDDGGGRAAGPGRAGTRSALAVGRSRAADRGPGRRRGDLAQHHPDPHRGPAPDGRRGRRCACRPANGSAPRSAPPYS